MKEIETKRLYLVHITEDHIADIFAYAHEPNVGPNAGWEPHATLEDSRKIAQEIFINQPNVFGIVLKESQNAQNETQKMIGSIGFLPDPRRQNSRVMMLGYAMSEKYWGQGIMTEAALPLIKNAFEELQVDLLTCTCYAQNARSRRVIEKCGFSYEWCLRQVEVRFDGVVFDLECFSLARPNK